MGQNRKMPFTWRKIRIAKLLCAMLVGLFGFSQLFSFGSESRLPSDWETFSIVQRPSSHQEAESSTLYKPAPVESWIMDNLVSLGWDAESTRSPFWNFLPNRAPSGCTIWHDQSCPIHKNLHVYLEELTTYYQKVKDRQQDTPDVRKSMQTTSSKSHVCSKLRLHPDGLPGIFKSNQLSWSNSSGYMEPLTTPMRHPKFCLGDGKSGLMSMEYLIHDFEAICNKLSPTSRTVLIDMGASLDFHGEEQPIASLVNLYKKFGIRFDHIYGFEIKFTDPEKVFTELLPSELLSSYHWINTGVNPEKGHIMNPWESIVRSFNEDDLIVVKLDIDTPSVELPLAYQLLQDESLAKLIDQFYFEHHVGIQEMEAWGSNVHGTIQVRSYPAVVTKSVL